MSVQRGMAMIGLLLATAVATPVLAATKPPVLSVKDLTTEYENKLVQVEARVTGSRTFKAGIKFTLDDGTGRVELVLFDRVRKSAPLVDVGARVRVLAKLEFYKEQTQLVPARGKDITVLAVAPPVTPMALKTLVNAKAGERAVLSGQVVESSHFKAGFKLGIDDGTGRARLTLFERTFDAVPAAMAERLTLGAWVTATGSLSEYEGALELVVDEVMVRAGEWPLRDYALGRISGNDHNASVRVRGMIKEIKPLEFGIELLLQDDTGLCRIRLDDVVAKRVQRRVPLEPGRKIEVLGRVRAARSSGIRIDVALPGDIQALEISSENQ